jgi:hypothetical protein
MVPKAFAGLVVLLVLSVTAPVSRAQNSSSAKSQAGEEGHATGLNAVAPSLIGTWRAPTERLPLSGEFNEKVWGKSAVSVRDVSLTLRAAGDGVLTVSRKVLDARGRVVPGSASTEQADITVGDAQPGFATRLDHAVKVLKAERSYPDDPKDRWPLENLKVGVVSFTDGADRLEVRFDPADGKGSFSELLTRQRGSARR